MIGKATKVWNNKFDRIYFPMYCSQQVLNSIIRGLQVWLIQVSQSSWNKLVFYWPGEDCLSEILIFSKEVNDGFNLRNLRIWSLLSVYNKVRNKKNGDSVYVRAMIDHMSEKEGELSFRKDDLLHIEDTMYNGQPGVWYAWIISDEGKKIKGGTVPSKDRWDISGCVTLLCSGIMCLQIF